jgi:hypothetical protein
MKGFYQVQNSKERTDKRVGKGRQKHIENILGRLRRDQFSGDARAYPK